MTFVGWAASAIVLGSYGLSVRQDNAKVFHWGNVVGSILMGLYTASVQAWPSFVTTAAFGLIGAVGLIRRPKIILGNIPE